MSGEQGHRGYAEYFNGLRTSRQLLLMPASWNDTIAAIATARGTAALAIVRVSGPEAIEVVRRVFRSVDLATVAANTVHFGYITSNEGDIDQVVVTVFRGPESATGEDVVEVSCHGGDFAAQMILRSILDSGARMAEPGEFTKRGFLNSKIDLTQAEAIADLIHASSSKAHRVSLAHLKGRYSTTLANLRDELVEVTALLELELDFSDEDVEFADRERLVSLLDGSEAFLTRLLDSYQLGERVRDGIRVVIGGRPNAGKSTLLNALVGHERAIVSDIAGTTRDEIESDAEISGLRFRFVDTAGLRETVDQIEAEGVRRAERSISASDILIYIYDASIGLDEDERAFLDRIRSERQDLPLIIIANKTDLVEGDQAERGAIGISARMAMSDERLLEPLINTMLEAAGAGLTDADSSAIVMNQRHLHHLRTAREAVRRARAALDASAAGDMLSYDLRIALDELGAITGEITNEDVLDQIFSRFCIGK